MASNPGQVRLWVRSLSDYSRSLVETMASQGHKISSTMHDPEVMGSDSCRVELGVPISFVYVIYLNPKVDTPLVATNANPLQLYHSPRPEGENLCL